MRVLAPAAEWCDWIERVDPELGLRPHDGRRLPLARNVLVSSLAADGAAAWIVLAGA